MIKHKEKLVKDVDTITCDICNQVCKEQICDDCNSKLSKLKIFIKINKVLTMCNIRMGSSRICFLISNYAIKIPNFLEGMRFFLIGCNANYTERFRYKLWFSSDKDKMILRVSNIVPTLFCSWFGLINIQYRCKPLERELTNEERTLFESIDISCDLKKENMGFYKNKLVLFDYQ